MKTWLILCCMAALWIFEVTDAYSAMSCSDSVITTGMTKLDVISKCGEPDLKEVTALNSLGVRDRQAFRATTSPVEIWHYNCGAGRFNKSLYFEDGALVLVKDTTTYGSGPVRCT
jgi:hypothetical protein